MFAFSSLLNTSSGRAGLWGAQVYALYSPSLLCIAGASCELWKLSHFYCVQTGVFEKRFVSARSQKGKTLVQIISVLNVLFLALVVIVPVFE